MRRSSRCSPIRGRINVLYLEGREEKRKGGRGRKEGEGGALPELAAQCTADSTDVRSTGPHHQPTTEGLHTLQNICAGCNV